MTNPTAVTIKDGNGVSQTVSTIDGLIAALTGNSAANPSYDTLVIGGGVVSGANPVPVQLPDDAPVPFSVTAIGDVFVIDTNGSGAAFISLQMTSMGSSGTMTIEGSNDGNNWSNITTTARISDGLESATFTTASSFLIPVVYRYIKGVLSGGSFSGTVSGTYAAKKSSGRRVPGSMAVTASSTNGASSSRIATTASTNISVVSASHNLYAVVLSNNTAAAKYIKFYDKSTAPVIGTDAIKAGPFVIPPNTTIPISFGAQGLYFNSGLGWAITGGAGDSDATNTAVGDVTGVISYG